MTTVIKKIKALKNRYFPRLATPDLVALGVFFIILAATAFFFLRRAEYVYLTVKISDSDDLQNSWVKKETPEWYIENLNTNLEEKNIFGVSNIKVERVYYYPVLENVETVFVDLKVRAVFNKNTRQFTYKGTPLLIGSFQNLSVNGVRIAGIISYLGQSQERAMQEIIVKGNLETQNNEWIQYPAETGFEGVKKYLAEKITRGLTVKDNEKNVVAEVLEVSRLPAYRSFISGGQVIKTIDTDRENVELTVKIKAEEVNGSFFYQADRPVYIDQILELTFDDFKVTLTVHEIE